VAASNRAPSYKAMAIAILNNDHMLKSLGFYSEEGQLAKNLRQDKNKRTSPQQSLFL